MSYIPEAQFAWMEDFESAGLSFTYAASSDTIINKISAGAFEGLGSGQVYLDIDMDFFEARSPLLPNRTINGPAVFLEMNFKTNEPVLVGLFADNNQQGVINLNVSSTWKKIYINLTDFINSNPGASNFQVFFGLASSNIEPFGVSHPEIFIDNIKIVHF